MAAQDYRRGLEKRGRQRPQGSLFEEVVDVDAVRESLGVHGLYKVAMDVRESMLRRSRMYRELPLDVFNRAADRAVEDRLVEIGHQRGLFLDSRPRLDFR